MNATKVQIPEGMQDTLTGECVRKRCLERQLRTLFALSGFREIETPLLEYYGTFDDEIYGFPEHHVWKTFDRQGRVLALRPDSTIPAVRIAASSLKSEPLPLRLCYIQNVAAFRTDTAAALCESTQAGVELMGEKSPLADAEMIALAIRSLQEAGLHEFQIDLGQVAFFKGFMEEAGLTSKQTETFRSYVEEKNTLAMQLFLNQCAVPGEVSRRLMKLPQLYGDESVLKEARAITQNETCREALDNLQKILEALGALGCAKFISIDLGMVHAVNYYSGMIFRGITGFLGQPLLSGGRYDGLPERFGRAMPATGFGLSVNLLMMALGRQGEEFLEPQTDFALGVDETAPQAALEWVAQRREEGIAVALYYGVSKEELVRLVNEGRAKAAAITEGGRIAVFSGEEQSWK